MYGCESRCFVVELTIGCVGGRGAAWVLKVPGLGLNRPAGAPPFCKSYSSTVKGFGAEMNAKIRVFLKTARVRGA
jgi:hypothetical protein